MKDKPMDKITKRREITAKFQRDRNVKNTTDNITAIIDTVPGYQLKQILKKNNCLGTRGLERGKGIGIPKGGF